MTEINKMSDQNYKFIINDILRETTLRYITGCYVKSIANAAEDYRLFLKQNESPDLFFRDNDTIDLLKETPSFYFVPRASWGG